MTLLIQVPFLAQKEKKILFAVYIVSAHVYKNFYCTIFLISALWLAVGAVISYSVSTEYYGFIADLCLAYK